jgi:hypothetical protein
MAKNPVPNTPASAELRRSLASEIALMKDRLFRVGLHQTSRQLERAVRLIGYEIAAIESGDWPVTDLAFLEQP